MVILPMICCKKIKLALKHCNYELPKNVFRRSKNFSPKVHLGFIAGFRNLFSKTVIGRREGHKFVDGRAFCFLKRHWDRLCPKRQAQANLFVKIKIKLLAGVMNEIST